MTDPEECRARMRRLQASIREHDRPAFLVTAQDSIYYLTGVTYVPLERPFFILVRPAGPTSLLAPALDREHLASAPNVGAVASYWDYPSPPGLGGFRHSDTVLVTAGGYECLTRFPDSLEQLTLGRGRALTRLKGALVRRAVGLKGPAAAA